MPRSPSGTNKALGVGEAIYLLRSIAMLRLMGPSCFGDRKDPSTRLFGRFWGNLCFRVT